MPRAMFAARLKPVSTAKKNPYVVYWHHNQMDCKTGKTSSKHFQVLRRKLTLIKLKEAVLCTGFHIHFQIQRERCAFPLKAYRNESNY